MFKFVVVVICVLLATALAQHHDQEIGHGGNSEDVHAEIIYSDADVNEHGYRYKFATTNHIEAEAEADEHGNARGNFKWISPEGKEIEVSYLANEEGYLPKSDVLPTPPPIPEAIIKALQYIESHPHPLPQHEEVHHGRRI